MPPPTRCPGERRPAPSNRKRSPSLLRIASVILLAGALLTVPATSAAANPPTPQNLYAASVSATSVTLWWGTGPLTEQTHWRVYRDGELVAVEDFGYHLSTELTPGTTYSFVVVAVHVRNGATSAPSETLTVTTDSVDLSAPTGFRTVEVSPARVVLEFDRPTYEADVWSYHVYDGDERMAVAGRYPWSPTVVLTVRQLQPGSEHTFTARIVRSGFHSAPSDPLVVTTPTTTDTTAPTTPTGLTGEIIPYSCDTAVLSWQESTDDRDAPEDLDYEVLINGVVSAHWARGEGSKMLVLNGTGDHQLAVRAVDSSGNASPPSGHITVTVDPNCVP